MRYRVDLYGFYQRPSTRANAVKSGLLIRRSLVRAQVEEPEHMQEANLYRLAFLFAGLAMNGAFLAMKRRQRVVRPVTIAIEH